MDREDGPFLTIGWVARELGISRARAYKLAATRQIPTVRRGRTILVPTAAWHLWVKAQAERALATLAGAHAGAEHR
jgi:excisionase family DNA binding protein